MSENLLEVDLIQLLKRNLIERHMWKFWWFYMIIKIRMRGMQPS
jgi:hypothetical protein